ncbi:MAG: leucine-rich repeat domain-containing protein, partial [Gemmatimonadota bacterium]|nr:leucine-rich repeat domain-containing protein [Gemmatimonadota bacterium]
PSELGALTSLKRLDLSNNELSGEIPSELGALTSLKRLDLSNNYLSGEIPSESGALTSLEELDLNNNNLSGEIPAELGALASLGCLGLGNNGLSGEIPAELGELTSLDALDLSINRLSGEIPRELVGLRVVWLDLSGNRLTGAVPSELDSILAEHPYYVDLSDNRLSGRIPPELGELRFDDLPGVLDLSGNDLSGPIPPELGNLVAWELDLSDNLLDGTLPPELGNLHALWRLDLGDNLLAGPLPLSLTALDLSTLRYQNTGLCIAAGDAMRAWLDAIPDHVGSGDCTPPFGDHGSWMETDWDFANATVSTVGTQMRLKTARLEYPAYAVRGHALTDWDVRAKMGGANPAGRPWLMLYTGDYRYPLYSLRLGSGQVVGNTYANYIFTRWDALQHTWETWDALYGTSTAVQDTAITELAVSLQAGTLRVYASAIPLIGAELTEGFPKGLVGYGLATWPTTDTAHAETKFDWIEIYGTELGASMASDQLVRALAVTSHAIGVVPVAEPRRW